MKNKATIYVLIAEDDEEDRLLIKKAIKSTPIKDNIFFVENGEELTDYLENKGKYTDSEKHPLPGLIILDLNMPKKDGREALKEIKSNENLKRIPIVVLTTSKAEEDILKTYNLGVNSFITKPVTFASLVKTMQTFSDYWIDTVVLPNAN
jgi:CheY-like chemotaxis protein